jgi:magnesium transporter
MQVELAKDFLPKLKEQIENNDKVSVLASMVELYANDICEIMYELDDSQAIYILEIFDDETAADIISNLEPVYRKNIFKKLETNKIALKFKYIDSDDAVDILNDIPTKEREEIISYIDDPEKVSYIIDLLHYEPNCAGGIMAKELIKANINWGISQCIDEIRRQAEKVDKIHSIYVVDDKDYLLGRVSLKKIILSNANMKIKDIYETEEFFYVESYKSKDDVAKIMEEQDLEAIPVVNVQGKLLGRITIDDVVDVIKERAELEQQLMSGISGNAEEYDSVWLQSRVRLPWLLVGMIGGLMGAKFIGLFEADLALIPAMAFFIPLITATGGNVGIQSSTVVVQSLANKSNFETGLTKRLGNLLLVGLLNGLVISLVVFLFNIALGDSLSLAIVVSISLLCVVMLSSIMGTITPIVLNKFGINPALASGPFITTANDLLGLGVYFIIAHSLLQI